MAKNTVVVSILADSKPLKAGLAEAGGAFDGLKNVAKAGAAAAAAAVAAIGVAAVKFGVDVVKAGSTAQQSLNGISKLFGDNAQVIVNESKKAADQWGISAEQYRQSSLVIEGGMVRAGMSFDEARSRGDTLRGNLLDLVSVYGGDLPGALDAYGAAMRGEFDPLEQFGVKLKESAVQAKAKEMGLMDASGQLDEYGRALATTALIEEQAAAVQGASADRAETFAGKVERLQAKWDNFKETVGMAVLPVLEELMDAIGPQITPLLDAFSGWFENEGGQAIQGFVDWIKNEGVPAFLEFSDWVKNEGIPALMDFGKWVKDEAGPALKDVAVIVRDEVVPRFQEFSQWCQDNSWVFDLIGEGIKLLVSGWVALITVITAVVEFFSTAYENLQATWENIKSAFDSGRDAVGNALDAMKQTVQNVWNNVIDFFKGIPDKIKSIFSAALDWLRTPGSDVLNGFKAGAVAAISAVLGWFGGLGNSVVSAVGSIGGRLASAGSAIINGFVNAAKAAWEAVKGFFSGIGSWIADHKGPVEKDRKLLTAAGTAIMQGFGDALADGWTDVQRMVKSIAPSLAGTMTGDMAQLALAGGGTVNVYQFGDVALEPANDAEAGVLAEFVATARRKARAGGVRV